MKSRRDRFGNSTRWQLNRIVPAIQLDRSHDLFGEIRLVP